MVDVVEETVEDVVVEDFVDFFFVDFRLFKTDLHFG